MDKDLAAAFAEAGEHVSKILAGVGLVVGGLVALREIAKRVVPQNAEVRREMLKRAVIIPQRQSPSNGASKAKPTDPPGGVAETA